MSRNRKSVLFDRGAEAAQRSFGIRDAYLCPLCGAPHERAALESGDLTLEHVPPRSVGGKAIALTCRRCNSMAGASVDAMMRRRADFVEPVKVIHGHPSEYIGPAVLEIGGEKVNVELSHREGKLSFNIISKANDPRVISRVHEHMKRASVEGLADGEVFHVKPRATYHVRQAKIGDLRAALLAAFATFGYRYALHPDLELVRRQILEPEAPIIPDAWTIRFSEHAPEGSLLVKVHTPSCVVVKFAEFGVLLQWPPASGELYREMAPMYEREEKFSFKGTRFDWPTGLHMLCDFQQDPV